MTTLTVNGLGGQTCIATIRRAVHGHDPQATVTADLAAGRVTVDSVLEDAEVAAAIEAAGYEVG